MYRQRPGPSNSLNSRPENKSFIAVKTQGDARWRNRRTTSEIDPRQGKRQREPVEDSHPTKRGTPLVVEQIIRPTGLLDPVITLRPLKGQIDETIELCRQRVERDERVLVTTLTKRPRRISASIFRARASRCAISTPTSMPSSGWRSCANFAPPRWTCWWASTCCGKASTCRRCHSFASSTRTRKASCAMKPR